MIRFLLILYKLPTYFIPGVDGSDLLRWICLSYTPNASEVNNMHRFIYLFVSIVYCSYKIVDNNLKLPPKGW